MSEVDIVEALDGAEAVRAERSGVVAVVQVWYGGTQVRVFTADASGSFEEVSLWTMSDGKGRAVSEEKILDHMEYHFAAMDGGHR